MYLHVIFPAHDTRNVVTARARCIEHNRFGTRIHRNICHTKLSLSPHRVMQMAHRRWQAITGAQAELLL